jgi:hypothetical protein
MATFSNKIMPFLCHKFECKICDYNTSKKSSYNNHIKSKKHNINVLSTNSNNIKQKICSKKHLCTNCYKEYNDRSGLWRHKKKCEENNNLQEKIDNIDLSNKDDLIMMLLKQNSELLEIVKNGTNNTTNTNCNNHSNNKTFNLQFFLNETCKDAMNITDFIDSIKLQLSDLERVGEIGYIEGISNIITNKLSLLDVTQRPIHCTDKKREVLYVKDDDKWEKEDEDKKQIRKLIKKVSNKNISLIPEWKKQNPDCIKYNSKKSDICNQIIIEAMGGKGDNDKVKEDKIIKNISKNVIIDKENSE